MPPMSWMKKLAALTRTLWRSGCGALSIRAEAKSESLRSRSMMREIAAVQKLSEIEALKVIDAQLRKNQKRAPKPDAVDGAPETPDIEEAA